MTPAPRWWTRTLIVAVLILAFDAAVFVWAWGGDVLGLPAGTEDEEWFKLGAGIVSGGVGLLLLAVIIILLLYRWIAAARLLRVQSSR